MCFTIRYGKRLGESLGSCNVSSLILNVSHWSRLKQNFERLGLGDMGLGSRLGLCSEGLVHIPGLDFGLDLETKVKSRL